MSKEMHHLNIGDENFEVVDAAARSAIGAPAVAETAADMIDTAKVYVYIGSESGYTFGNWYYHNGTAWTSGGVYQSKGISAGSVNGQKLSDDLKEAFLNLFAHLAYTDANGQTYYNNLLSAFNSGANLVSIEAMYTQSGTVYDTASLDDLRTDLVVTAYYDDETSRTISSYELSGTLTSGTSTITVSYGGMTDTFTVTVISIPYPLLNGEFVDSTNTFKITVTNGYHIKAEVLSSSTSTNAIGINLYNGNIGIGNSSSTPTLNQPEKFAIPSGTICTLSTTDFSNDGIQYVMALRYTSGTTSMLNTDWQTVSMNLTETTSANASIGCVFLYLKRETAPVGSILEFDVTINVGGVRYV